jgi:signal transduction histidine kinase
VGTVLGVAILAPATRFVDHQPKQLYLDEARNGDRELPLAGPWHLPWRMRNLKVRFSLLSYHREADTRFRSRLVGLEAEPSAWTPAADREFVTLPPGSYTLQVWGRDHAGNETGPLERPVVVEAPPWLRWWALLGYILLLTGGVLLLILWRVRRLQRQNARLAARVSAATAEVRRQNEALGRINQHLARLNEEKSSMLGIAAHDLRNPLSAIGLFAEVITRSGEESGAEAPARRIQKLVGEMSMLIERLLNSSRIDAGQISLQMEGVEPCLLLRELAERHRAAAEAKQLMLELDLPPEGAPALLADPFHLMEVLDNLVSNALKFMPPGPPARRVTLRVRDGLIEIQDEGPGFTEEDKEHAFERFRRLSARPTAGEGSTGLGLSIARALLEAMGGELTLHSEHGQGATFRIHLGRA